jgi:hypothetical protein
MTPDDSLYDAGHADGFDVVRDLESYSDPSTWWVSFTPVRLQADAGRFAVVVRR